ncbi:MAG: glutamine amidotransferase [Eubacteriales bacterium]|nr:glutamine amidotransferase [Eubacteriales bacterium]
MEKYKLNILYMYPELLNMYYDVGNIRCLSKRLEWRNIDYEIIEFTMESDNLDLTNVDLIFIGGGSDREQMIVSNTLRKFKDELTDYIEDGGSLLAICGGYQLLGKYYQAGGEKIEGVGVLDICTQSAEGEKRLTGDILIQSDLIGHTIIGFENHGGRTQIGDYEPLGRTLYGYGNDDTSNEEGLVYKNLIGTYLHGPILPKNPKLADYILTKALKHKYPDFDGLSELDDILENQAHDHMVNRLLGSKNLIHSNFIKNH